MPTVLVTGAAGFIGRATCRELVRAGWTVFATDAVQHENSGLPTGVTYVPLTLPSAILGDLIRQASPDACIHCAGRASVPLSMSDPTDDFRAGPALTFEVLDSLRTSGFRGRFIQMSSAAVYGDPGELPVRETAPVSPLSPYGFHKYQSELLLREFCRVYGFHGASLRVFSAYGVGLRRQVIWDICRKVLQSAPATLMGTGKESRDFIHVSDVAQAARLMAERDFDAEVFNVASGVETTVEALALACNDAIGLKREITFDGVLQPGTPRRWQADIAKLRQLGFERRVELADGIRGVATWCLAEAHGAG